MKMKKQEAISTAEALLKLNVRNANALPTNGPDRHWNWRIETKEGPYLLRVENPLAVKQRRTKLRDEAKLLRLFSAYDLAPRLIHEGRHNNRFAIIEEWLNARHLPKEQHITRHHLAKLVEFLARVNAVPVTASRTRLIQWKNDFLDVRSRKAVLEKRMQMGRTVAEFRPHIKKIAPVIERGLEALRRKVRALPASVVKKPTFCYRDIGSSNILATTPHYKAVDWEYHSVGISDPSFSLVVLMRRFSLGPKRMKFVLRQYRKRVVVPHLGELLEARNLERVLGEGTWPLAWVARWRKLPFLHKRSDVTGAIKQVQKSTAELKKLLNA